MEMRHASIDKLKIHQDWGQHEVAKGTGARHEHLGVDVDKESWEPLVETIEAVAVHRAIGIIDLLCVSARRLGHRQA